MSATHRPKQNDVWQAWGDHFAAARSTEDLFKSLELQSSTHNHSSKHGADYNTQTRTTSVLIRHIREDHVEVVEALASVLSQLPSESSLLHGKVLQAMQHCKFVKTAFSLSHIFAALVVATAVLDARLRAGQSGVVGVALVNFGSFGHHFALRDGPNVGMFRRTHHAMLPVISQGACAADEEEADEEDEVVPRRLKKRRSDTNDLSMVGKSLSRWLSDRMVHLFGDNLVIDYRVRGEKVRRRTGFYHSEICTSANICQAQKFMELLCCSAEIKNLRPVSSAIQCLYLCLLSVCICTCIKYELNMHRIYIKSGSIFVSVSCICICIGSCIWIKYGSNIAVSVFAFVYVVY